jgi:hypothetical protein
MMLLHRPQLIQATKPATHGLKKHSHVCWLILVFQLIDHIRKVMLIHYHKLQEPFESRY